MSQSYSEIGTNALIRMGLPVTVLGLNLFPIKMSHYEDYISCKDSLLIRMSTLPLKYMTMDYFSAIYALEMDFAKDKPIGVFSQLIRLLQLSLRVDWSDEDISRLFVCEKENNEIIIKKIRVTQNNKIHFFTPQQFSSELRPMIAKINGLELPDESENVDLVRANEEKAKLNQKGKPLKRSADDLIASVAFQSKCRESDIMDWTVKEFFSRIKAIEREKRHSLYGQAELSGMVSFKNGNPAPSWCYDVLDNSLGTQSLAELNFGNAKQKEN